MTRGRKASPDEAEEEVTPDRELRKVERWRLHVLSEAGYPFAEAQRLAMSEADLHIACEILKGGCPVERAVDILL